jgi:hypothetical protein
MGASDRVRRRCRVAAKPNDDGAVTLYGAGGRTYQAIDASEAVRGRVGRLGCGDAVTVVLEPVRCRGDGWRLVRFESETPRGRSAEKRASPSEERLPRGSES